MKKCVNNDTLFHSGSCFLNACFEYYELKMNKMKINYEFFLRFPK